jgi:integrase
MREFWKRKRPDGKPGRIYWTNLQGQRVSTGQSTEGDARIWKRAREREGADPRLAAAEAACLEDAIGDLYAELRRRGRAAATQKRARDKLGHFARLWGLKRKMSTIDSKLVNEYIDKRLTEPGIRKKATVQRITIRDELAFLRQTLKLAYRNGVFHLHAEDVLPILFETGHKPKKDYVRFDKIPALVAGLPKSRRAHALYFCVCGGRAADSERALREDFDVERWRITVRGSKTAASWRTIPVPEFLRPLVTQMLELAPGGLAKDDPLFWLWEDGSMNRDLRIACEKAGIGRVSSNGLRRTFGHALRSHGFDLDTISKLFGHTTAKLVRDVYADVDGDELAEIVEHAEAHGKVASQQRRTKTVRGSDESSTSQV